MQYVFYINISKDAFLLNSNARCKKAAVSTLFLACMIIAYLEKAGAILNFYKKQTTLYDINYLCNKNHEHQIKCK